jgi:hypothetical protein
MSHHVKEERTGKGWDYGEYLYLPCPVKTQLGCKGYIYEG